jgi:superfamily II DNA or RNA helicase
MSFYDPSAKYLPSYKIGRWNGKISYFDLNGKSYFHLLKEILEVLDEFKYKIQKEDRRQNKQIYTFDAIDENYLKNQNIKWPETHHLAGKDIILRDYQVEVVNYFLQRRHAVQEVATGAGKTIITAVLAKIVEKEGRTITIVPSKTLVKQTYEDYKNIGLDVGVFFGDQKDTENKHIIATWQSLEKIRKSKKEENIYEKITKNMVAVIVDECHIAKAPSLKKILGNMYKNVPIRWGLTATLPEENYLFYAIK